MANDYRNGDIMNDKVVVITGASGGIGAALAVQLGSKGYSLVLGARRERQLNDVAAQSATRTQTVICDVRQREDIERLRDSAFAEFGRVDVWVNNAGQGIGKKVLELTAEDFDEMMSVNLKSALFGMQAIIPHFQERGIGHLINISSFLGRVPLVTFRSAYSASKAALNVLTANLRMDLRAEYPSINISLVMPGVVTSDFSQNALGGTPKTAFRPGIMKPQTPEEAAAAIVELIENPRPEIYTNPALNEIARQYCLDKQAFEDRLFQGSGS